MVCNCTLPYTDTNSCENCPARMGAFANEHGNWIQDLQKYPIGIFGTDDGDSDRWVYNQLQLGKPARRRGLLVRGQRNRRRGK